jgi:uncharacterized protein YebE (UPF0316 family)
MENIIHMVTAVPAWELALIFIAKLMEVAIATLRLILINKGYRKEGTILSFFEISLWVFLASYVIVGLADAPIKAVVYSIGFSAGVYLGSRLEEHLAFGNVLVQAITSEEAGVRIAATLREKDYGVTSVQARGKENSKMVLMIFAGRKGKEIIIEHIKSIDPKVLIVINEVSTIYGGYFHLWKQAVK